MTASSSGRRLTGAALAAAMATLGGCATQTQEPPATTAATPAAEFFDSVEWEAASWTRESITASETAYQEDIAACMKEQGFDYTPVPPEATIMSMLQTDAGDVEGSVAYAENYGYLITDTYLAQLEHPLAEDPNIAYRASMNQAERDAYDIALTGWTDADWDENGTWIGTGDDPSDDESRRGCEGVALLERRERSGPTIWDDPDYADLKTAYYQLLWTVDSDPRVSETMPIWSSCMAEDGHNYATPDEAQSAAADLTQPLWEWAPTADPSAGSLADQPEVIEVRDAEVAIAVADARCRESSGLTAARAAVTTDLETTFARENKETMDTLLNRYPIGAAQ